MPGGMYQITGNGAAAIMIPFDCSRELGAISLTHKRFKSGQFRKGLVEHGFLMSPITTKARGGVSESPVKFETSGRICNHGKNDRCALADTIMAFRQFCGYCHCTAPPERNADQRLMPVDQCPKLCLVEQRNLISFSV